MCTMDAKTHHYLPIIIRFYLDGCEASGRALPTFWQVEMLLLVAAQGPPCRVEDGRYRDGMQQPMEDRLWRVMTYCEKYWDLKVCHNSRFCADIDLLMFELSVQQCKKTLVHLPGTSCDSWKPANCRLSKEAEFGSGWNLCREFGWNDFLGGGFNWFLFSPLFGKIPIVTNIFEGVATTNTQLKMGKKGTTNTQQ